MTLEEALGKMGASYPFEIREVVKDEEHTLMLLTSQYVLRFNWNDMKQKNFQKTYINVFTCIYDYAIMKSR